MPQWSSRYTSTSKLAKQQPVYVLVLFDHYGAVKRNAIDGNTDWFTMDTSYTFEEHRGPLMLFNRDVWEFADPYLWDLTGASYWVYAHRGQYGTTEQDIIGRDSIGTVRGIFSTGTILDADMGLDIKSGYMSYPSGLNQSLDMVSGRLQMDPISLNIQDRNQDVTRMLRSNPIIGRMAIIMGGYEGMKFTDYSFLHVGRVDSVEILDGSIYNLEIDNPTRKLSKKLFNYLDAWTDTLVTGGVTDTDTDWSDELAGDTPLNDTGQEQVASGYYAAHFLRVQGTDASDEHEFVRLNTNGVIHGVIRGQLGTTAIAHGGGSEVTLAIAVEDNPIDVLLSFLLNDESITVPRDTSNLDGYPFVWDSVPGWGPVGVGIKRADLNLESFETIRNNWFRDYWVRIIITRGEQMKPFIEKHLLKPYGLCLYVNNHGQLSLGIMRPTIPVPTSVPILNADDIVGIPPINISSRDIVNEVSTNYDYDEGARDYDSNVQVLDQGSQTTYDHQGVVNMDARGLVTGWFAGENKALKISQRKRQRFSDPNPEVPLEVLFSHNYIDPMSIVRVVHAGLPDHYNGTVGWDKYMLVVGKRVRWDTGTLILDVIDTGYAGKRYCTIAPSGQVDYDTASESQKLNYGFISDANQEMGDGSDGYQIM